MEREITAAQCRAARALIRWSRKRLAEASRVGLRTIIDFEDQARRPRAVTADALRRALEAAGVVFVEENGEGPGVRLKKRRAEAGTIAVEELDASNDE